jgi:recombination protein RecA
MKKPSPKKISKKRSISPNKSEAFLKNMEKSISKSKKFAPKVFSLGESSPILTVKDVLSTGLPNLDKVLCKSEDGRWGLPVGRIISVKSKPSVGKTTFLLRLADQAYSRGGVAHIIESEHALEISYARKICKNVDNFLISQPDTLEEAFDIVHTAVHACLEARKALENTAPFVIIMDSFSGFTTEAELSGDFSSRGKAMGEHARLAALACRKLTGLLDKAKAILVLSHQSKSKIGVYWGSKETNIGGDAFNYHDSICLSLYRTTGIKDSEDRIMGHYGMIRTSKNKLFPPHREVKFKILNGRGFIQNFSILEFLINSEFITSPTKGSYLIASDPSLKWRGIDNFSSFLSKNPKAKKIIKQFLISEGVMDGKA